MRPWAKERINRIIELCICNRNDTHDSSVGNKGRKIPISFAKLNNELFHLNNKRLEVLLDKDKFQAADWLLGQAISCFRRTYVKELKSRSLHPIARKALKSLYNHWNGLLIFVDHPEIPMDNNLSERKLREPVLGRKNYYGSGSQWSGDLTVALFTIFQTARLNHLHPKEFLKAYLEACAENRGKAPENIDDFLPWNLSEKQKSAWQYPQGPPL